MTGAKDDRGDDTARQSRGSLIRLRIGAKANWTGGLPAADTPPSASISRCERHTCSARQRALKTRSDNDLALGRLRPPRAPPSWRPEEFCPFFGGTDLDRGT